MEEKDIDEEINDSEQEDEVIDETSEIEEVDPFEDEEPKNLWKYATAILIILLTVSIYTDGFQGIGKATSLFSSKEDVLEGEGFFYIVLNDARCKECQTEQLVVRLQEVFPNGEVKQADYSTKQGKQLYESLNLTYLPAVLFTETVKDQEGYASVEQFLEPIGKFYSLRIGAQHDPNKEICDNGEDDNGDGKIDCDDNDCLGQWECMPKLDKPEVELFVMSYCPYGTQIEKGMIPVVELLGSKIKFDIKFVDYAMHGEKELDEQLVQYCVQKDYKNQYIKYLSCFLEEGKGAECLKALGLDVSTCVAETDEKYSVTANFNDQATYKGSFPTFNIHKPEVMMYSVQGSPTLVVNGVVAQTGRSPQALLDAVCLGFKDQPEQCSTELSTETPAPGFGFEGTGTDTAAGCTS